MRTSAELSIRPARPAAGPPLLIVAVALAGAVALVAALTGIAAVLLVGTWFAGIALTFAAGLDLRLEERLCWGAPIGAVCVGVLLLLGGLVEGRLSTPIVLLAMAVPLAAGLILGVVRRPRLRREVLVAAVRWRRFEPWPLWLLLAACWPYTLVLLGRSYRHTSSGILSGTAAAYADWSAHLTYASSFAYAANFPPRFPIFAGHAMTYPFLVDLWTAGALVLGARPTDAITVTSGMLALALPPAIYLGWLRLAGRRAAAILSVILFLLSGGLGFVVFFQQLAHGGTAVLGALPQLYTQGGPADLQWLNPVLAWILPQRDVLLGFAAVPICLGLLWSARGRPGYGSHLVVGVFTGLLPLANLDAFGTVVALGIWWALLERRGRWAAFLIPALVLGVPQAVWLSLGGAASLHLEVGWMSSAAGQSDPVFWLLNTGLLIPVMALAFVWRGTLDRTRWWHLVPIWLWFLVPNVLVFQPWDWDNTKFFAYWLLVGSVPAGAALARLWTVLPRPGAPRLALRALTAALLVSLCLAGTLDLTRALQPAANTGQFLDAGGITAAGWVRGHTDPHAIFLVAPDNNQAIPVLSGRTVVAGYDGWTWSYGLPGWSVRKSQVPSMLAGHPGTAALVREYGVNYVVIGPQELSQFGASPSYWAAHGRLVYDRDGYLIFHVSDR